MWPAVAVEEHATSVAACQIHRDGSDHPVPSQQLFCNSFRIFPVEGVDWSWAETDTRARTATTMSDEDARIPLLHGEERDDKPWRATSRARFGMMVAVAAVAGVAYGGMTSSFRTTLTSTGLPVDDRPTLYALLDHEPFAMQLKNLQCYKKMAKDAGMQLAVGPFVSSHFDSEMRLEDLVDNSEQDWRP